MKWEQMTCPECGELVYATYEVLDGQAILTPDDDGGYDYEGTTEVFWNNQHTSQVNGKDCLLCVNGHEWTSGKTEE